MFSAFYYNNQFSKLKPGFTLLELMITLAVIGLLISLAAPSLQSFLVRAKMQESLGFVSKAQLAVAEQVMWSGTLNGINNQSTGIKESVQTSYVDKLIIQDGAIQVYLQNTGSPLDSNFLLWEPSWDPDRALSWHCKSSSELHSLVPHECRNALLNI